eukprot:2919984-Rhodomonas_salina.1
MYRVQDRIVSQRSCNSVFSIQHSNRDRKECETDLTRSASSTPSRFSPGKCCASATTHVSHALVKGTGTATHQRHRHSHPSRTQKQTPTTGTETDTHQQRRHSHRSGAETQRHGPGPRPPLRSGPSPPGTGTLQPAIATAAPVSVPGSISIAPAQPYGCISVPGDRFISALSLSAKRHAVAATRDTPFPGREAPGGAGR